LGLKNRSAALDFLPSAGYGDLACVNPPQWGTHRKTRISPQTQSLMIFLLAIFEIPPYLPSIATAAQIPLCGDAPTHCIWNTMPVERTYSENLVRTLTRRTTRVELLAVPEALARDADAWKAAALRSNALVESYTSLVKDMNDRANVHVERLAKMLPRNDGPADPTPIETVH
jgi:hypothetical protein